MRFLCEVSVKASLWKCIWDEPWKKIGILRGERWKNTASWGNRVSVGFLLYKLYKPWVRFWKAMLLAVCFWIHKLSYKGWKALHRKIAGFFFFILLCANYMLIESHAVSYSIPFKPFLGCTLPFSFHRWGNWDFERSIHSSEIVFSVNEGPELWIKCLSLQNLFTLPFTPSKELGIHEERHWIKILDIFQ